MTTSDVTLAQLRVLLAIIDSGSFTLAAEQLGITQSGVSQAVAGLESALQSAILVRDRHGITPTALGDKILSHARIALAHVECIQQEAAVAVGLATGRLRLGSVPSAATRLLPPLLRSFRRRHPNIELVLLEATDQEVREWVLSHVVDVGFAGMPLKGLRAQPIAMDEMLLVLPQAHQLASHTTVRLEQIAAEPFLMSKGGCEPLIRMLFKTAGVKPQITLEVREMMTLLSLVKEGLGVTIVPQLANFHKPLSLRGSNESCCRQLNPVLFLPVSLVWKAFPHRRLTLRPTFLLRGLEPCFVGCLPPIDGRTCLELHPGNRTHHAYLGLGLPDYLGLAQMPSS